MATPRKPFVRYHWRTVAVTPPDEPRVEVTWSLYGGNGEYMAGSGSEGYRDKTDARRAMMRVAEVLGSDRTICPVRELGPGLRPV